MEGETHAYPDVVDVESFLAGNLIRKSSRGSQ